jgi:hypothetical protein
MNIWALHSLVIPTFVVFKTEEYSPFIFLGTEEYKQTKECVLFSCSEYLNIFSKSSLPKIHCLDTTQKIQSTSIHTYTKVMHT